MDCLTPSPTTRHRQIKRELLRIPIVALCGLLAGLFCYFSYGKHGDSPVVFIVQSECVAVGILVCFRTLRWLFARWTGITLATLVLMVSIAVPIGFEFGIHLYALLFGKWIPLGVMFHLPGNILIRSLAVAFSSSLILIYVMWSQHRLSEAAAAQAETQRLATETQLRMLQTQIEPHMLFNTLANLHSLIETDPQRAMQMTEHLIVFLRRTLSASRSRDSTLADEFTVIGAYLDLMAIRMGARLTWHLELPADLSSTPFPPMLLQPLVENAIKHGLEPKIEGGHIEIGAAILGDRLVLTVNDSGTGLPTEIKGGYGLQHVRERLKAIYGERAELQMAASQNSGTCAQVSMPI